VLQELQALAVQEEPGMFDFFRPFPWILKTHCYDTPEHLIADLDKQLIGSWRRPWLRHSRARQAEVGSSQDFACWRRAQSREARKFRSAPSRSPGGMGRIGHPS
jgi:hypothetical protein